MSVTDINGVQVNFPYAPYQVQQDYMAKVLECLQQRTNGILESPTGTGKTLSLLCSSLAWLETKKAQHQLMMVKHSSNENSESNFNALTMHLQSQIDRLVGATSLSQNFLLPKIIYSSRTHAQLSQAVQELRRTSYSHIRSISLGSREQLCLLSDVSKIQTNAGKIYACRTKVVNKACPFHLNYEEKILSHKEYQERSVMDIEDLITLGKKYTCCPYYASRNLKAKADMVFVPYNYIIDPKIRRSQGIELEGNVVIFDEGHNIEGACEESMSFQLRSVDLALCINEVSQTMTMIKDLDNAEFSSSEGTVPDFTMTDLSVLKVMFCEVEEQLDKEVAQNPDDGSSKPGDYMIDILSKVELTPQRRDVTLDLLDKIVLFHSASAISPWSSKGAGLLKFSEILKILFSRNVDGKQAIDLKKAFALKYRVYLQYETNTKGNNSGWENVQSNIARKSWKLDCWCFSPGIGMQDVMNQGVYSILLTSGTLSPLPPLISELGINFPVLLENPHIVDEKQVFIAVITHGPDGTQLNSSYKNRFDNKYINSLGRTIANFCRVIPNGVLTFFPSYSVMKSNVGRWEETGVWQSLSGIKPVMTEPQGKDAFAECIEKYYAHINNTEGNGATFLGVCRGKVSEGLDFADKNARAVIVTGLPFPPSMDKRVKMKMQYLDASAKQNSGLVGSAWYILQASRAINQAIGRVIRHKDDYGAILLCDNRFAEKRIQSQLSRWVQGRIKVFNSFGPAMKELSGFFKELESNFGVKLASAKPLGAFQLNPSQSFRSFSVTTSSNKSRHSDGAEKLEDSVNIFNGYKKYENSSNSASDLSPLPTSKPASIFDAMKLCEDIPTEPKPGPSRLSGNVSDDSVMPTQAKRMKLSINLREVDKPEEKSPSTSLIETPKKESDREMWKKFLMSVKSVLGATDKYSQFCSSVKQFRSNKDSKTFAIAMCEIFRNIPSSDDYLKRTALLVNTQERAEFLSICAEKKSSA